MGDLGVTDFEPVLRFDVSVSVDVQWIRVYGKCWGLLLDLGARNASASLIWVGDNTLLSKVDETNGETNEERLKGRGEKGAPGS